MTTLQSPSMSLSNISQPQPIRSDFIAVALWAIFGLVLTALMITLGFDVDAGLALVVAG